MYTKHFKEKNEIKNVYLQQAVKLLIKINILSISLEND